LLDGQETRNSDTAGPSGPTLIDFYLPDCDRHSSGLQCFAADHTRSYAESDTDIAPLQVRQDKADHLTDSESDDEEVYAVAKPSIENARGIVRTLDGGAESPSKPLNSSLDSIDFAKLDASQRIEEQVELMRDRKTLDLESSLLRIRREKTDSVAKLLTVISKESKCIVQALPTMIPFSSYEEKLHRLEEIEVQFPSALTPFVEDGANSTINSPTKQSMNTLSE